MNDERPVHELEHDEQPVTHRNDEDMTILARWLRDGMERGASFWLTIGAVVVALVSGAVALSVISVDRSTAGQAWVDLIPAKTAEDRLKVADAYPKTPVSDWARLYAANEEYESGLIALTDPKQREIAGPRLKKALDTYRQVAAEAPKESSQARGAAFGVARTLEARNEIDEAIKQYRVVAETYKGTPEAKQAAGLIKALEDPESRAFYKELYAFKPPATNAPASIPGLPPGMDLKSLLPSGLGGPMDIAPPPASTGPLIPPAATPEPAKAEPKPEATAPAATAASPKAELPANSFIPTPLTGAPSPPGAIPPATATPPPAAPAPADAPKPDAPAPK